MTELIHHTSLWPLLEECVRLRLIDFIDFALAEHILASWHGAPEQAAAFVCHLSASGRQGHLCIHVDGHEVFPAPQDVWLSPEGIHVDGPDMDTVSGMITDGAKLLSDERMGRAKPIRQSGTRYYFQKQWVFEEIFIRAFCSSVKQTPALVIDEVSVQEKCRELIDRKILLPEQAEGIRKAALNSFTIICGGPGTGKTHTAGILIRTLCAFNKEAEPLEIALAAPTGKAAANLQKSLSQAMEGHPVESKTLHRLLGVGGRRPAQDFTRKLSADVILVDESSMIDLRLMAHLFSAIKPGARLIMLGDPHQLPPVEAGSLFADIVQGSSEHFQESITILKTCLRAEKQELIFLGRAIVEGDTDVVMQLLNAGGGNVRHFPLGQDPVAIVDQALPYFLQAFEEAHAPEEFLRAFNRFRILSPLRQGPWGVDALNQVLRNKLKSVGAVPIMLTGTNESLELFNGEVGVLIQAAGQSEEFAGGDCAYFASQREGEPLRRVSALLLPKFEYAYAISVYKSQGSEFDHVMFLLPEGSESFGREVFYTAVTRAKCRLDVWGEERIIKKTLEKRCIRLSGVCEKLSVEIKRV